MPRYIALLRAINVGGRVVKMDRLRDLFLECGLRDVETFIASGNVVFSSASRTPASLERKIAPALMAGLGYEVATFIRTPAELMLIAARTPFPNRAANHGFYIGFTSNPLTAEQIVAVAKFRTEIDDFHVEQGEIYWSCRTRSTESKFSLARLERAIGAQATFRNSTTIQKLADRCRAAGDVSR